MAVAVSTRPRPVTPSAQEAARETLEATARAALRDAAYDPVQRVECIVRDATVFLSGRVSSFYLKQIAQCVVSSRLNGAATIDNRIEVTGFE